MTQQHTPDIPDCFDERIKPQIPVDVRETEAYQAEIAQTDPLLAESLQALANLSQQR